MLCAEEGDGAEARGGRTPQPGSAHSSAGVLLPHPSWLKRFHAPPPPYPRNRCIHPSPPPPPFALCSSVSPLGVFRGAEDIQLLPGHCWTAAPRTSSPTDAPPPPAHAVPAAPGCPPLSALPFLPYAWLCLSLGGGAGPGLPLPIDPKGRAGHRGAGGAAEEGRGAGRGGGGPRVPPLPHCCSSAATRDRGSVLFCTSWPSPLYSPPPPPSFYCGVL